MSPEEVEKVVGAVTDKDVMHFAKTHLWDKDIAISAVGQIEGYVFSFLVQELRFALPRKT